MAVPSALIDMNGIIYQPVGRVAQGKITNVRGQVLGFYDKSNIVDGRKMPIGSVDSYKHILTPAGRRAGYTDDAGIKPLSRSLLPVEYAAVRHFFIKPIK